MSHTLVPPSRCPKCGYLRNCLGYIYADDIYPKEGDFSICSNCAAISIVKEDLTLREMTEKDRENISQEQWAEIVDVQQSVQITKQIERETKSWPNKKNPLAN